MRGQLQVRDRSPRRSPRSSYAATSARGRATIARVDARASASAQSCSPSALVIAARRGRRAPLVRVVHRDPLLAPRVHLRALGVRRVRDRGRRPADAARARLGARRADRRRVRTARCSACSSAPSIGFGLYTAVKASYLSTTFAIRVEERNLIYLSPIVFVVAARWLLPRARPRRCRSPSRPRRRLPALVDAVPRLRAPLLRRLRPLDPAVAEPDVVLDELRSQVAAVRDPRRRRAVRTSRRARPARGTRRSRSPWSCSGCATIAWNLTGEISAANQAVAPAKFQRSLLPTPPDWIDRADGPRAHDVLRQGRCRTRTAFWSLEFWNQSIQDVWSVDASAPPPGPTSDAELPRHRRRGRPAAAARLGRRAARRSRWRGGGRAGGRPEPLPRAAPDPHGELRLRDHARRLDAAGPAGTCASRRSRSAGRSTISSRPRLPALRRPARALHVPGLEPTHRRRRPAGRRAGCSGSSRRSRRPAS